MRGSRHYLSSSFTLLSSSASRLYPHHSPNRSSLQPKPESAATLPSSASSPKQQASRLRAFLLPSAVRLLCAASRSSRTRCFLHHPTQRWFTTTTTLSTSSPFFTNFNFVSHLFFFHLILLVFNLRFYEVYECDVDFFFFVIFIESFCKNLIDELNMFMT